MAQGADPPSPKLSAMGLGRVLDQCQAVVLCDLRKPVHGGRLTVEVDRQNGFCALGDRRLDRDRIQVVRERVDIGEDRGGAGHGDRLSAGDEGEWGRDHLIARTDTQGAQHQLDRRRAGADSYGISRLAVGRKRLLECSHLRPQDEAGVVDHPGDGRVDLRLQGLVLRFQVD